MNAGNRIVMQETLEAAIDQWWNGENGIQANDGIDADSIPIIGDRTFKLMAKAAVAMLEAMEESQRYAVKQGYYEIA